jgi:hypothetical protein
MWRRYMKENYREKAKTNKINEKDVFVFVQVLLALSLRSFKVEQ